MMVAITVLHHLLSSVKINKMTFFLWLILNTLLATAAPQNNTVHFVAHGQGVVQIVWYNDRPFKQWALMEHPVTEKKSATKIHRQLKNFTVSMLLIKSTIGHCT
jgi:hypothetical protein